MKKNKDIILNKAKEYYINNKDILNRSKNYYEKNKDIILNKAKEYYINNKDVILNRSKDFQKQYRESKTDEQKQKIRLSKKI